MSRSRVARRALLAVGLGILLIAGLRIAPLFTGSPVPAGATPLRILTERPNVSMGCPAALLAPARVAISGDDLVLVNTDSGLTVGVVWPAGFRAWRSVDGRAAVADPWGTIIAMDGDVLDFLGGGLGVDDRFHICPFGLPPRSR